MKTMIYCIFQDLEEQRTESVRIHRVGEAGGRGGTGALTREE